MPAKTTIVTVSLWLMIAALSGPAVATLGEPAASVQSDARTLGAPGAQAPSAMVEQPPGAGYSVAQLRTAAGTVVREYLTPGGIVFGVSWRGAQPPDLAVLLGSYFGKYQSGTPPIIGGSRRGPVNGDDLVVQTAGHMLDLWGRAYVPSLLPAGVSQEVIQ